MNTSASFRLTPNCGWKSETTDCPKEEPLGFSFDRSRMVDELAELAREKTFQADWERGHYNLVGDGRSGLARDLASSGAVIERSGRSLGSSPSLFLLN